MVKKIKTCVFISGNGTNLQSIIKSSRNYNFPIKVVLIVSDNKKSKGFEIAKKYSIPYRYFQYKDRSNFERKCFKEIKKRK